MPSAPGIDTTFVDRPPAPSRRSLFGTGVALLTAGAALAAAAHRPHPGSDAELLGLCAEFHRENAIACNPKNGAWKAALARRWKISDEIEALSPETNAGRVAKAAVALVIIE